MFFNVEDKQFYLLQLKKYMKIYEVDLLSYCLMTNHVHLVLVPTTAKGLQNLMKVLHAKYAYRINKRNSWSGHLWQYRYFSSILDERSLAKVVRYVELNPVRAHMVPSPDQYQWSSAKARICNESELITYSSKWNEFLPKSCEWKAFLADLSGQAEDNSHIQTCLYKNLPYASESLIQKLGEKYNRFFGVRDIGRPKK